jgi:GDP-L-fucose synthase
MAPQPIREDYLLTGPLEPTNEGYAIAKIAGLKLCEWYYRQYGKDFISAMPTNLYGPYDNFHPNDSHVIPGMMRRFHEAKEKRQSEITIWGSGKALRDFLHVDDLAAALLLLMEKYSAPETINVGSGSELTIAELARLMKEITAFEGDIVFDTTKPDGTPRKIVDIEKISRLGWSPQIGLKEGLSSTYEWACKSGVLEPTLARQ